VAQAPTDAAALEQSLASTLVNEALQLMHAMESSQREFVRHWLRRLELINLKLVLRAKFAARESLEASGSLLDLGPLETLPVEELARTESVEELLRRLESSPYAAMARQARKAYQEGADLFAAEAMLDTHYYHQLVLHARRLSGKAGNQTRALLADWLDQVNLVSLLRFRLDYRLEAPQAYFLLAPGGHLLPPSLLQRLAQQETLEQFLGLLPASLQQWLEGADRIETVEQRMITRVRRHARRLLRRRNPGMSRAFAWLYLREQQLQLVHTVLKGHLLGLPPELIQFCADPLAAEESTP
jgi:V/A-type H+-transporting ATPase subunit C